MFKKLLAVLVVLLFALPVYGQNSANTNARFIEALWASTAHGAAPATIEADVEAPSWATGLIVQLDVTVCTGCVADLNIRTYLPGTSTETDLATDLGTINSATAWMLVAHPYSIDMGAGTIEARIPAVNGTIQVLLDITAGTAMTTQAWVRWIK